MPTPPFRRRPKQPKFRVDTNYHRWQITGLVCVVCDWPLDRALRAVGTHVGCFRQTQGETT